ncbi:MAG: hypothetical protein NDF58_07660 [archaeon YNP-LCB-024-027]|nr:hypothetical protein [Candidatus Culexarchaeum yellowstonense]
MDLDTIIGLLIVIAIILVIAISLTRHGEEEYPKGRRWEYG